MSTSSSSPLPTPSFVNHIAVKPPPFYHKCPAVWFRQMESQFELAKITLSSTKYHHVLSHLPEDIASNLTLSDDSDYEKLKEEILSSLKQNKHLLIEQALSRVEIGDKRPTQLVVEIKKRFSDIGLPAEECLVKSRLLSALPCHIKSALVGHDSLPLDQYAKVADSMLAVAQPKDNFLQIGAVRDDTSHYNQQYRRNYTNQSNNTNNRNVDDKKTYAVRPFFPGQRPRICNSHIFYAHKAKNCRPWCQWTNKPRIILKENEYTPANSRSNSPTNL